MPDNVRMIARTPCPYCNASVSYGIGACGLCGAALEWTALPDGFRLQTDAGQHLEIVRSLGRGGFGVTYLADFAGARVAVKECFPDGLVTRDSSGSVQSQPGCETEFAGVLRKFLLEARLLGQIRHPVSTKFLACWTANNTAYLMMEFIDGETLEARIARGDRLSEFEAIALLEPILDLLEGVHAQQLLHRDIKPANIMLTKAGVELIDFGSVLKFDPKKSTFISSKMLTPAYAPLELYGSQVRLGPSSDLYSLAASVYEAMTGVRVASALDRTNGAIVQPLEAILNSVSREFSKLIARALELRIDDRFDSAQEMRAALRGVPVFSKPVSSVAAVQSNVNTNAPAPSRSSRFRMPPWALALVGLTGLIFGVIGLIGFMEWRNQLEQTRLANEAFLSDQCRLLSVDHTFGCTLRVLDANDVKLEVRLNNRQGLLDLSMVLRLWDSPEVSDFVYELAGNAMDLLEQQRVEVIIGGETSGSRLGTMYKIDRTDHAIYLAQPTTAETRKRRASRAKKRLTMPSSETYLQLVGKREVTDSAFAKEYGLKIDSLSWGSNSSSADGASMFVTLPGDDDLLARDTLMFALNPEFRLGLRDMILRLHRALPGVPYIAVFVGKSNVSAAWSVSVSTFSDDEFAQLERASDSQLNDIWSLSSEYLPAIDSSVSNAVNAWVVPIRVRSSAAETQNVLGVLQVADVYTVGRDTRKFQAPNQLEANLVDVMGRAVKADVINYGDAKLLLACCPNPQQDFKLNYTALDGFCCPGANAFSGQVMAQRRFDLAFLDEPPRWLRLRLSKDRSDVILECDASYGTLGVVVQVKPENTFLKASFTDSLEAPAKSLLSECKITVPFKAFGASNILRLLHLNFTSASLLPADAFGKGNWAQAKRLSASALETSVLTRDQLIALKRGESLEFGLNRNWVKK
jgi:serine/threonine protein kinase